MFEMEKVKTGNGWLININKDTIEFDIKHSYIGTILPGKERGNHYHKETKERFICLKGVITVKLANINGTDTEAFDLEEGDFVDVELNKIHVFVNYTKEDVYFINCVDKTQEEKERDKVNNDFFIIMHGRDNN